MVERRVEDESCAKNTAYFKEQASSCRKEKEKKKDLNYNKSNSPSDNPNCMKETGELKADLLVKCEGGEKCTKQKKLNIFFSSKLNKCLWRLIRSIVGDK